MSARWCGMRRWWRWPQTPTSPSSYGSPTARSWRSVTTSRSGRQRLPRFGRTDPPLTGRDAPAPTPAVQAGVAIKDPRVPLCDRSDPLLAVLFRQLTPQRLADERLRQRVAELDLVRHL